MVKRATVGATTTTPSMSFNAQSKEQATLQAAAEAAEEEESDEEGLLDGDDDDSAFMARYRRQRMRQIAGTQGLPKFGECLDVEPFEFVEELKCDARVAVVTLLHEDWIPDCREVAHAFDRLARKHVHTKFLRMKATSCSAILKSIDHRKDLPCIMIYRGGEVRRERRRDIHIVYCVPCAGVWCVLLCAMCYCVLCGVWCVVCGVWCVLCAVYCVLCTVYCVLCTVYCVLCALYCVLLEQVCAVYYC